MLEARAVEIENMTSEEKEQALSLVVKAVNELGEHFDSVRIFVTRQSGDSTHALTRGGGNHYASLGQISEWLDADKARTNWNEKPNSE